MIDPEKVMKRCQIGARNLNEANNLLAECYGVIGRLLQEKAFADFRLKQLPDHAMRETQRLGQEIEQEPVAWQFFQGGKWHNGMEFHDHRKHTIAAGTPVRDLYTTPPQRKPLTDEEIDAIADEYLVDYRIPAGCALNFARDIEAAHGMKENT